MPGLPLLPTDPHAAMSAVEAAYQHDAAALYRYIYRKVGHVALAEDLTSVVFLKALRWLQQDRGRQSIRGWLYATARTTIAEYWRTQGVWDLVPLDAAQEVGTPLGQPETEAGGRAARVRVQRLLRLLPERERRVLTLRYFQGYSTADIGQALGLSTTYVRVVQFRALRQAASLEAEERSSVMDGQETGTSEGTQRVLAFAHEEAVALNHTYIGTEHLLLGLLRAEDSRAARLLAELHVTLERVRGGVLMIVGRGEQPSGGERGLTPRAKTVLALAAQAAQGLGSPLVEPEHLLLGLLDEGAGIAAGILETLNVRVQQVRALLSPTAEPSKDWTCSFCGKGRTTVDHLIHGPGWVSRSPTLPGTQPLLICNECVALCARIIATEAPRRVQRAPSEAEAADIRAFVRDQGPSAPPAVDPAAR